MCQSQESVVSIVKMVGSQTGFLCMESCLVTGIVNACLIPEK